MTVSSRCTHTKIGQRTAAFEASVILDPMVPALYRRALAARPAGTAEDFYIFAGSESQFYPLFQKGMEELGVSGMGFRPYSLRRGGATAFYRATCDMPATIERGRWATIRVARIYINDGLAKELELQLTKSILSSLSRRALLVTQALQGV